MSLEATIRPGITATYSRPKGYGVASFSLTEHPVWSAVAVALGDGIGPDQADIFWVTDPVTYPTIPASGETLLDLSGTTDDALGDDTVFAKVKALAFYSDHANTHVLRLGAAAANGWVGPFVATNYAHDVSPGGLYINVAPKDGWIVTPGTVDILRVRNVGVTDPITWHGLIIGTSA